MKPRTPTIRRGFTLVEAALCTLMASGLLVGSLTLVASRAKASKAAAERVQAQGLARALMAEITAMYFVEPDEPSDTFGPSTLERSTGRSIYDDVDDYDEYSDSPPVGRDGVALDGADGFARSVQVFNITDAGTRSVTNTGIKLILVQVSRNGAPLAELSTIRTRAMDDGRALPDGQLIVINDIDDIVGGPTGSDDSGSNDGLLGGVVKLVGGLLGG